MSLTSVYLLVEQTRGHERGRHPQDLQWAVFSAVLRHEQHHRLCELPRTPQNTAHAQDGGGRQQTLQRRVSGKVQAGPKDKVCFSYCCECIVANIKHIGYVKKWAKNPGFRLRLSLSVRQLGLYDIKKEGITTLIWGSFGCKFASVSNSEQNWIKGGSFII